MTPLAAGQSAEHGSDRDGFTLLEVLLTSLLASVVLVALWSLSDIYLRMFASGKKKVEETQLVRGLTAQFAKDVAQVLQVPLSGPEMDRVIGGPTMGMPPGIDPFGHSLSASPRSPADTSGRVPGRSPGLQGTPSRSTDSNNVPPRDNRLPGALRSGANSTEVGAAGEGSRNSIPARGTGTAGRRSSPSDRSDRGDSAERHAPLPSAAGSRTAAGQFANSANNDSGSAGTTRSSRDGSTPSLDDLVPRFGLRGTSDSLRLIVLQTDPLRSRGATELSDVVPLPGQPRTPFAFELKTIQYTFAPPGVPDSNEGQHPPGLVRREWAWETWSGLQLPNSASASGQLDGMPEWTAEDDLALKEERDVYHLPQVTGIEFRYFDGFDWDYEWDSFERQSLPVLIEVGFWVSTTIPLSANGMARQSSDQSDETETTSEAGAMESSLEESSGYGTYYRQLLHLPYSEESELLDESQTEQVPLVPGIAGSDPNTSRMRYRQP